MKTYISCKQHKKSTPKHKTVRTRTEQQFFSNVGTELTLMGINQYFEELMYLAQGHYLVPGVSNSQPWDQIFKPICHDTPHNFVCLN